MVTCTFRLHPRPTILADGKPLRGLRDRLRLHFYSKYDRLKVYKQTTHTVHVGTRGPAKKKKIWHRWSKKTLANKQQAAMARGNQTDQEITKTVDWARQYRLSPSFFLSVTERRRHSTYSKQSPMHQYCNKLSRSCRFFWKAILELKLTPMQTQVPVCYQPAGVGTLVDVVACDPVTNKKYILEIKDGYDPAHYFKCSKHPLNPPFQKHSDCEFNQHQLQLHYTKLFYHFTFPNESIGGAFVIRVHSKGVDVYPQQKWLHAISDSVLLRQFQLLCATE